MNHLQNQIQLLRGVMLSLFGAAILLCSGTVSTAQTTSDDCFGGRTYLIAYPDTVRNAQDSRFLPKYPEDFTLFIYSSTTQNVRVGRPGRAAQSIAIQGGTFYPFDTREVAVPFNTLINTPNSNVLEVEASDPLIIYAYLSTHFGTAAFTPLPVESWGTDYYIPAWPGDYVRNIYPAGETNFDATVKVDAPAEILILAAEDGTEVLISPTADLKNCVGCERVTLNAGESYQVQSRVDTNDQIMIQPDIAGTRIQSSKPIGVISGNTRTQLEKFAIATLGGNSFKDLALEWVSPISMHGTEFVFMPTWDYLRQGVNTDPEREAEFVRLYGTNDSTTLFNSTPALSFDSALAASEVSQVRIGKTTNAHVFHSTNPAMAYQSPKSVPKFNGTTGSGNFIGASYKSWGTYMTEMVPRERWGSFAPFRVPTIPTGMQHYINVVASESDKYNIYVQTGNSPRFQFSFNQGKIPGTDLVWGTQPVDPGLDYVLTGDNGAVFTGTVYGSWGGFELYRPGGTEGDGKGAGSAAAHPSEYEEAIAQMYAYPLASVRCTDLPADDYDITTTQDDCGAMTVTIVSTSTPSVGLKYIRMNADSSFNTRLEFVSPPSPLDVEGRSGAIVRMVPINPRKPAIAILEFRDRSRAGKDYRVYYFYVPEYLTPTKSSIDFGEYDPKNGAVEKEVVFVNDNPYAVGVRQIRLLKGNTGYSIVGTEPSIDWSNPNSTQTVGQRDSLVIRVRLTPGDVAESRDSLIVDFECLQSSVALNGSAGRPCLSVSDIDFGRIKLGETVIRQLEICNSGVGEIKFGDSALSGGADFITWAATQFKIESSELEKLRSVTLGPGQCVTISVSFRSLEEFGVFRVTARIWTDADGCDDESVWQATVIDPSLSVDGQQTAGSLLGLQVTPNPTDGRMRLQFNGTAGTDVRMTLLDLAGRQISEIYSGEATGTIEQITWEAGNIPAGLYFVRLQVGESETIERVYLVR